MNVLVVDDQRSARRILTAILSSVAGLKVIEASTAEDAVASLAVAVPDLAFVDVKLREEAHDRSGLALAADIRARTGAAVVVVTAIGDTQSIRQALRAGAAEYLLKEELCDETVLAIVDRVRDRDRLRAEVIDLRVRRPESGASFQGIIGASRAMLGLRHAIERVAVTDRPVLVTGPSGAGKELVVRAIHALSPRPGEPLIDLNCGAIPEMLIESQLFGHERGAFTGADRRTKGILAAAGRGTVFLDEIAELPAMMQSKLLRVLETRRFRPVGAVEDVALEARIVAATHADLAARTREGRFREDLFHRLDVLRIRVPSLAERRDDIPALVAQFANGLSRPIRFESNAIEHIAAAEWPGNVRQLRNFVDRLSVFCDDDPITAESVDRFLADDGPGDGEELLRELARKLLAMSVPDKLDAIESALVAEAMRMASGNKSAAARLLGVHRKVVERRCIEPGSPDDRFSSS